MINKILILHNVKIDILMMTAINIDDINMNESMEMM